MFRHVLFLNHLQKHSFHLYFSKNLLPWEGGNAPLPDLPPVRERCSLTLFGLHLDFYLATPRLSTNKLKTDYPSDLKLWLIYFYIIIFSLIPFKNAKKRNVILNSDHTRLNIIRIILFQTFQKFHTDGQLSIYVNGCLVGIFRPIFTIIMIFFSF